MIQYAILILFIYLLSDFGVRCQALGPQGHSALEKKDQKYKERRNQGKVQKNRQTNTSTSTQSFSVRVDAIFES